MRPPLGPLMVRARSFDGLLTIEGPQGRIFRETRRRRGFGGVGLTGCGDFRRPGQLPERGKIAAVKASFFARLHFLRGLAFVSMASV